MRYRRLLWNCGVQGLSAENCSHNTTSIVAFFSCQEVVSVTATTTITEGYAHQLLRNERPPLEVSSAGSSIGLLHANHFSSSHVEGAISLHQTRSLLKQLHFRRTFLLLSWVHHQQSGPQLHPFSAGCAAWRPIRPISYLARRIDLLFQARWTRWLHAFYFLNEEDVRTPFTTHTIVELPRPHLITYPAG